jgi:hypothetical protein
MPVINGVYLKDFTALPSSVTDANIIPIAITGNQVAYRTTVGGIVTDARVTSKLLTGLSVTGGAIAATDTILEAFGKVQNQINSKVSSVGLTMPSAFNVANSPITSSGTLAVTAAGVASQYIRGDGALADFPTNGGGGSSVAYYLNGSVNQGTFVGNTYYEMNKTPVIGTGTDFTIGADGYIAQFITDANDPGSLLIPAGNWNVEMYFSASSSGGTPSFYVEVYKYNGTTFTLLGTSSATPEGITNGTAIDIYYTSVGIPETVLTITDRLAIRVYVTHSGRTITLHTEDNHLSEIITTFSNGINTLNGLTKQAQYFAVGSTGTDFAISSSVDTHTFNLPTASATNRGALSSGDWSTFNSKQGTITLTTTGTSGAATFIANTLNIPNYADGGILSLSAIGASPNANAATITGTVLNLEPASASFGGVVTTGTQTFAGDKTLTGSLYGIGLSMTGTSGDIIGSVATTGKALRGTATTGFGVYSSATTGTAIYGESTGTGGAGINGTAGNGIGGYFLNNATGFATLYVTNNGSGNLANFSNSAGTKFTINNAGNLGNGTYTYTLPSATGTLALTSALSGYLPLTGGTLTGALSGTSATFSTTLAANNSVGLINLSATGYGTYIRGGTSSNYALYVTDYNAGTAILDANLTRVALGVPLSGTSATFSGTVTVSNADPLTYLQLANTSAGGQIYTLISAGVSNPHSEAVGTFYIRNSSTSTTPFRIASTGAATFSSSVTGNAVYIENNGTGNGLQVTSSGSAGTSFIFKARSTGVDRFWIGDTGNVGIGTTTPDQIGYGAGTILGLLSPASDATSLQIGIVGGSGATSGSMGDINFFGRNGTGSVVSRAVIRAGLDGATNSNFINFFTMGAGSVAERMRITSGGEVLVGTTTTDVNTVGVQLRPTGLGIFVRSGASCLQLNRLTSDGIIASFRTSDVERGSISISGATTSYNTSSDYRLKEDFKEVKGLEKVQAIKVYDYKWKSFDSRMDGVLAHELAELLPYAVNGVKDEVDEDGNDKMQGVDYSKLVPIMIKAIQELKAEIDLLKGIAPIVNNLE